MSTEVPTAKTDTELRELHNSEMKRKEKTTEVMSTEVPTAKTATELRELPLLLRIEKKKRGEKKNGYSRKLENE
ncbi:MAG: hypothetical protein LBM93_00485 [Oscillospiraceae bacterium]|jgi:hypothetical protein|nr:hypothetical protein [Oscillospiraceae bacterium]